MQIVDTVGNYSYRILADHHNRYDFTNWDIFITVLLVVCVGVGWMVKHLLDEEEKC